MKQLISFGKAMMAMLFVVAMMTSCLKEEENTFVLPAIHIETPGDGGGDTPGGGGHPGGGSGGGGTTPTPYTDTTGRITDTIVPPELRDSISDHFDFNEGTNPPNVNGLYVMSPRVMTYHSQQGNTRVTLGDYYFGIIERDGSYLFLTRNNSGVQYNYASVTGEGRDFSVSFIIEGTGADEMSSSSWYKASVVMSGTIEDGGVRNCQYVYTMRDKYDPCGLFIPIGTYYVCRDADGLAKRTSW